MADDLLTYYERELNFLRQMGAEFAAKYPKIASRLQLEADVSEDPHVERLIQAFSFLAARVHHKIEDEYPEITESLLNVLYPHYLAPIPSMSIVQFVLDADQGKLSSGYTIQKGATLYSQPVGGSPCRFRTCYPTTLWPLEVEAAGLEMVDSSRQGMLPRSALGLIKIELCCLAGMSLAELQLDRLRFFIHGEGRLTHALYELLLNNTIEIRIRPRSAKQSTTAVRLPATNIQPVGFGADEALLPYGPRSFLGYRLLQEYFCFPEKFLFFDLTGLNKPIKKEPADAFEVQILLNRMPRVEQPVTKETFRLGCAPIVNLFSQIAEPIRLSHAQTEYQVMPDVRRQNAVEVYTVDSVLSVTPGTDETVEYQPFYSFKHAAERERQHAFWYAARRASPKKGDNGTEVYLSLVDLDFRPTLPPVDTIVVHATCSNRDLPSKLPFGGDRTEQKLQRKEDRNDPFQLEGAAPLWGIRCLKKPTETMRAPLRRGVQWRLISHLTLNYLSLFEGGPEALQEILRLYDVSDSAVVRQQIAGIISVAGKQVVGRPRSMPWNGFCRGLEVTIEFDEEKYVGSGVFLFASVLERFLGLYTSLNSFTQVIAKTQQRQEILKRWPPRAGEQILL
jgi:type VI secretion system protein ImpG